MAPSDPVALIRALGMRPHPEGGHYVETFRDPDQVAGRPVSTAILYLLAAGERSHWHRVDATEIWHWHAGAPLRLGLSPDGLAVDWRVLGPEILRDERPQLVVPKGVWQSAEAASGWTLVGCTVAPGFRFEGFEMVPPGWRPTNVAG